METVVEGWVAFCVMQKEQLFVAKVIQAYLRDFKDIYDQYKKERRQQGVAFFKSEKMLYPTIINLRICEGIR